MGIQYLGTSCTPGIPYPSGTLNQVVFTLEFACNTGIGTSTDGKLSVKHVRQNVGTRGLTSVKKMIAIQEMSPVRCPYTRKPWPLRSSLAVAVH
jgi:hypothetical protein